MYQIERNMKEITSEWSKIANSKEYNQLEFISASGAGKNPEIRRGFVFFSAYMQELGDWRGSVIISFGFKM